MHAMWYVENTHGAWDPGDAICVWCWTAMGDPKFVIWFHVPSLQGCASQSTDGEWRPCIKKFSVCLATIVGTIGQVLAFGFVPTARSAYIKPLFIDLLQRMALLGILAPKQFGLMIGITGVVCSCRLCLPSFQIHQLALDKIGGTSSSCYLHMPTRAIVCFP